ncbi:ATP-binding cassette domain-containing protein [Streptomyces sp. DW26H14]|uniref:ATP-binding cassette domain-containing protein n=1 Tax=Streptomyces sp. DW26H14 TaxID=3435395 RepID=UPI00403E19D2
MTALDDISLTLVRGEAVAVVGASGCGKSTLLSCLAQHQRPTTGLVRRHLPESAGPTPVQLLFQDAVSSFNPRWTVGQVIAEALRYRPRAQADAAAPIAHLLHDVGLAPRTAGLRPAELSGGQAQRVALARALAAAPAVLLCDEPTTNLDVTAQAQILRLLARLRAEHHLTSVFVTHDLALVPHVADRVLVMAEGRVVEDLPAAALRDTRHPTTRRLLSGT